MTVKLIYLNLYTVVIEIEDPEFEREVYNESSLNDINGDNRAINGAINVLSAMNEDDKIGILFSGQPVVLFEDGKQAKIDLHDCLYNHLPSSDWVTVKEAKELLTEFIRKQKEFIAKLHTQRAKK